jgi:hypothetical protein
MRNNDRGETEEPSGMDQWKKLVIRWMDDYNVSTKGRTRKTVHFTKNRKVL